MADFCIAILIVLSVSMVLVQSANVNKSNATVSTFISGGTVTPVQSPFQISLRVSGSHICGGALISKQWIVTAAHCSNSPTASYTVKLGSPSQSTGGTMYKVTQKIIHTLYDSNTMKNDIAVMKLSTPVVFTSNIQPVALPTQDQTVPVGTVATVCWWDWTGNFLLCGTTSVVSNNECQITYNNGYIIYLSIFCTKHIAEKTSCQMDDGGPVVATLNGKVTLIGITSWSMRCISPNYNDVNTRITSFRKWITDNTGV